MTKPADKLLLKAFDELCLKYFKRLKTYRKCPKKLNNEPVHELRTAIRSLLSFIELLGIVAPDAKFQIPRQILKTQLGNFDELRDTQVMLQEITQSLDALPELMAFKKHLQQRELQLQKQNEKFFKNFSAGKLKRKLKKSRGRSKRQMLKLSLFNAIDKVYATALNRNLNLDSEQLNTIHRLRISVKKFRYILNSTQFLLPELPKQHTQQLKNYLTLMGEIQDSSVLVTALTSYFADNLPMSIKEKYLNQQRQLVNNFMANTQQLNGFWRDSAEQAFPWD